MHTPKIIVTAVVAFAAGMPAGCTSPERSRGAEEDHVCVFQGVGDCPLDEYAVATCQAFVDCWGPCKTPAECADCIEPLVDWQDGDLAAFDLGMCMEESCHRECTDLDADTCRACTDAACANYVAICEGRATYPDFEDGDSCYDINGCMEWCDEGDGDCVAACYWDGSSDGRVRFWHLMWAVMGPCDYACIEGEGDCGWCLDRQLSPGDYLQCLTEDEPETGCEGLEGVALCMCATNDASFCATL